MKKKWVFPLIFLIFVLLLAGCSNEKEAVEESGKPVVYTSFFPIYDLTKLVAGDVLEVRSFMPEDKAAHLWEPSPKDMKQLADADLLVVNGANMEPWVETVRENLPDLDVLVLSESVDLITYKGAAAIGDFQFMASLDLDTKKYTLDFGHTHEDVMRIAFFNNKDNLDLEELVAKGKKIMEQKGKLIHQKETIDVEDGIVYGIEMGHESGQIYYKLPEAGNWVFICDRLTEELLPYELLDLNGDLLRDTDKMKILLEGSSSGMDKITYDPHSWLSIDNGKRYINSIQDKFIKKYPKYERKFRKNKLNYVDALTSLQAEYNDKFRELEHREFIVMHYAYAYLARDFDLIQYPLQGLTSIEDPSLKTIKKAVDFAQAKDIKTIFYEFGTQPKGAQALAEEIGGEIVPLASMEYITKEQRDKNLNYVDLMEMNLENLYESMRR
ncbi:MAG: zinc ABC transporter substrate-binding protein [Tissierellia bacterium]|nr:zinc ABC transporter substrate-binding protein [Tissierellia bacterium]